MHPFPRYGKMRVKTVPRQRIVSINTEFPRNDDQTATSENTDDGSSKSDTSNETRSDNPADNKEDKEGVLDMSMKHKNEPSERDSSTTCSIAGPSSSEHLSSPLKEEFNSHLENNNMIMSNANETNCRSLTICSCMEPGSCYEDKLNGSSSDEDQSAGAVNLCTKDCWEESPSVAGSDERLKDTFLYKIMTDPTFLENIQKLKQSRKYVCQFCKKEFTSEDELADHMDVKRDELNQMVCCACKKTFGQKRYLRYHQRCHSEKTKFTCDICTKKYTRLDNLTRHNAYHVNPDKFSCSHCEKTFARKDLLNRHLKCHENKCRFFCELCHKYFKGPVTLENHKKIFHGTP